MISSKLVDIAPAGDIISLDQEAIEAARQEAEAKALEASKLAALQAEAKARFDAAIVVAKGEATTLATVTAPIVEAEVTKAAKKAKWLRSEVGASKARIEDSIEALKAIADPDERAARKVAIDNEMKTLVDWQKSYPVNKVALRAADVRSGLTMGLSRADAEAWADDHDVFIKREATKSEVA